MLKNKTVLKICSVVIAICLWVYVIGEVDPDSRKKISNIEVSYANTEVLAERGLAVADEETEVISVVIDGKRSDVNNAKKRGIAAYADVSGCKEGSNSIEITVSLPDGVRLESVSQEKLKVNVAELVSEEKPVQIKVPDADNDQNMIPWVTDYTPETVIVSGAGNIVDKIDHVIGVVDGTKVDSQLRNFEAEVIPVDKSGNKVDGAETSYKVVYADVLLLSTRQVKLEVKSGNVAEGMQVKDIEAAKTVIIAGSESVLEGIDKVRGTVDLSGMTESGKAEISIELPEGVHLYDKDSTVAEVTLEQLQ
ncbi:MAG: CdaR family protein [Clostridiales bacterium]|nr:CdaR family protein [Clostridiales bacterium]